MKTVESYFTNSLGAKEFCTLFMGCIHVLRMMFTINMDYFPIRL